MEEKKLSTAEILAKIRAQKAGGGEAPAAPPPASEAAPPEPAAAAAESAASTPAAEAPAKPAAPAAKPTSTKDILAAIRAKGAGGSTPAAPAADSPATPTKPAAAKPTAAAGPLPSVAEMVRAARQGAPAPTAEKEQAPAAPPPMPAKPAPAAAKKAAAAPSSVRRNLGAVVSVAGISLACFLIGALTGSAFMVGLGVVVWGALMTPFAAAWAAVSAVTGIAALGTARFMFPNVLVEPPSKFKVGPISDYPLNAVSNKFKDQFGIWIVHTDQYEGKNLIYALTTVCTHLGCTPNWLDGEQKFKCPCHGSGFYITGVNFEGPAPRPLERAGIRVAEDGLLEVDKSMKFQEEMGQWGDPASFVEVV